MRRGPAGGFTLIELAVVAALVAILAVLSIPAYRVHVLRAHRTEARNALLALATAEEKFYLQCNTYTAALDPSGPTTCAPASLAFASESEHGSYTLEVQAADTATWNASATAVAGSAQFDDARCRVFQMNAEGARSAVTAGGEANDRECWTR
jgi:type IV pilus assembly protein PilE